MYICRRDRIPKFMGEVALLGLGAKAVGSKEEALSRPEGPSIEGRRAESGGFLGEDNLQK